MVNKKRLFPGESSVFLEKEYLNVYSEFYVVRFCKPYNLIKNTTNIIGTQNT